MPYQARIHGEDKTPFPPRNSIARATQDCRAWVNEGAPGVAAEGLGWLSRSDDPDFAEREQDYDYLELLFSDGAQEEQALVLARQWLWDKIQVHPV